jgi:hypothetical protein
MPVMRRMAFFAVLAGACTAPAPVRSHSPVPEVSDPAPHASVWPGGLPAVHLEDRDGDGAFFEKCAGEREDFDGFEDDDGCAELDNDRDGILDERDLCPDAAEDNADGERYDGCPGTELTVGADLDADGVAKDVCPAAAEDLDGFEDDDGCPDRDDDGDGLLDAADQCPRAAEDGVSARGGDPRDGCPR